MIAVDTNVLVYAHRPEAPFHEVAQARVRELAEGHARWGIPVHCAVEFMGVVTHPRLWKQPSSMTHVEAQLAAWAESPSLRWLAEGEEFWRTLAAVAAGARTQGGAIHDARIAAICRDYGVTVLWTADRDFGRFPWLTTRNPLVA